MLNLVNHFVILFHDSLEIDMTGGHYDRISLHQYVSMVGENKPNVCLRLTMMGFVYFFLTFLVFNSINTMI